MIYHLQCFQCAQCGKVLDSGDHYIVNEDKLLCSIHYPNILNSLNFANSKNSSTELITDQEGEIVVKTEQSNLNSSLNNNNHIDNNQPGHHFAITNHHTHFTSLTPTTVMDNLTNTMSNAISSHNSHSFLLNRQTPVLSSNSANLSNNNLIHSTLVDHPSHLAEDRLNLPQSLNLIDYPSHHHHQPSLINNKSAAGINLNDFDSAAAAAEFYSTQSCTGCFVPPPLPNNTQLSSLSPHNTNLINNIYEQDALRFYNNAGCLPSQQQTSSMSAPTSNSPLNEIENTGVSPLNSALGNNAQRKGRPRKRKQIGLSSSNNIG